MQHQKGNHHSLMFSLNTPIRAVRVGKSWDYTQAYSYVKLPRTQGSPRISLPWDSYYVNFYYFKRAYRRLSALNVGAALPKIRTVDSLCSITESAGLGNSVSL